MSGAPAPWACPALPARQRSRPATISPTCPMPPTANLRALFATLVAAGALALVPATASALPESTFQADRELLQSGDATAAATLDELKGFGVDRIRVTVLWKRIAPASGSTRRPAGFDGANPADYPESGWAPYDNLVRMAAARGIGLNFNVTAPAPRWATARASSRFLQDTWKPSAREFGRFVTALGRRYSGSYTPAGEGSPLPRVRYWSIANEPNLPQWLAPQSVHGRPYSPSLYRAQADAAYAALGRTGHGRDTILIPDLAPMGSDSTGASLIIKPMRFIRALYCVDTSYRPLRGGVARAVGCPSRPSAAAFRRAHPVLFRFTGWSHHPYSQQAAPGVRQRDPNVVTLADLPRLQSAISRVLGAYHVRRRVDLYLTEYGYQTRPPDPNAFATPARQAAYINEADWIAQRNPRVRTMSQYLLSDDPPRTGVPASLRWSSFQSGLEFPDGTHKPSYDAYRLPLYLPATGVRRGGRLLVWGFLRPARSGPEQVVTVEFRAAGSSAWATIAIARTRNRIVAPRVAFPRSGVVRLAWNGLRSREVAVRVR